MRSRLTRAEDLPYCLDLAHNSFVDRPDIQRVMPQIWASLLQQRSLVSALIEDSARPPANRIQAVYLAVFADDEFIDVAFRQPTPRLVLDLYERILAGKSPVLGPEAIRRANSGDGLNCLMLHTGMRMSGVMTANRRLAESLRDLCVLLYSGYRIKRVIEEVVGAPARQAMEQSGFRLVTDYSEYFGKTGAAPEANDYPYLFMIAAEDVIPGIVSGVSFYFNTDMTRFDFAPMQQDVLLHALFNESDEELAGALGISVETVRKHWRAIYKHVADTDPEFFPGGRMDGNGRGPEKRRHLLSYLRLHLDEVRPRLRRRNARFRA